METKKRKSTKKKKAPAKTAVKKVDSRVMFSVWFSQKVVKGELKFWQDKEIEAFFKDKGLSNKEEPDKYEECLKLY